MIMMHFEQSTLFADKSRTAHSQNALTARAVLVLTRHRLRFRPFFGNCWCVFFSVYNDAWTVSMVDVVEMPMETECRCKRRTDISARTHSIFLCIISLLVSSLRQ